MEGGRIFRLGGQKKFLGQGFFPPEIFWIFRLSSWRISRQFVMIWSLISIAYSLYHQCKMQNKYVVIWFLWRIYLVYKITSTISLDSMNLKILFALWKLHITFQVFYTYFFLFLGEHQAAIHTNTAASLKWSTLSTFLLSGLVGLLLGLKAHQC